MPGRWLVTLRRGQCDYFGFAHLDVDGDVHGHVWVAIPFAVDFEVAKDL